MTKRATLLFVCVSVAACGSDFCGNEVFARVTHATRRFDAIVFQRDCGATTGFSTQVSILSTGDSLPNEGGNVLIIDGHPNASDLRLSWTADTLVIVGADTTNAYKSATNIFGLHIRYEQ